MKQASRFFHGFLNTIMSGTLAMMAILVFGNVVLRYAFNSGITWSEEMSRFLFIWLTFIGAIGALKDNQHLGMDAVVRRLPHRLKKFVYVVSSSLILYMLWLLFDGSQKITLLNMETTAPATQLPLSFVYGIGIVASVSMAIIVIYNLYRVFREKGAVEQLTVMKESEEEMLAPTTQIEAK